MNADAPRDSGLRSYVVCIPLALVLALGTFRVLLTIHEPHFEDLVRVVNGVLDGRPNAMAFQSRLLGPWLVWVISQAGISMNAALRVFHVSGLCVLTVVLFRLLGHWTRSTRETLGLVALFLLCLLSLQFYWYQVWDILDLVLLSVFCHMVLRGASLGMVMALFCVALTNRESAAFLAMYPLLSGFSAEHIGGRTRLRLVSAMAVMVGISMLAITVAYTQWVRYALFISLPDGGTDPRAVVLGNEFHLVDNLRAFFVGNLHSVDLFVTVSLLSCFVRYGRRLRSLTRGEAILYLTSLTIFANVMVFGIVIETRNFLALVPFLIFLGASVELRPSLQFAAPDSRV